MSCPKGKGLAQLVIDYGAEHDLLWTIFLENGESWTFKNSLVKADNNETFNRKKVENETRVIDRFGYSFIPC